MVEATQASRLKSPVAVHIRIQASSPGNTSRRVALILFISQSPLSSLNGLI